MIERRYTWKYGHGGVSAQVAGEVIKKIEDRDGEVTKESFLEESRPANSPTHKCFDWNDTEAAEKWRLHQAGQIIRDIQVEIIEDEKEPAKVPVFINTTPHGIRNEAKYKSVEIAVQDDEDYTVILDNAKREMRLFKKKYSMLKELRNVFAEIDKVIG